MNCENCGEEMEYISGIDEDGEEFSAEYWECPKCLYIKTIE